MTKKTYSDSKIKKNLTKKKVVRKTKTIGKRKLASKPNTSSDEFDLDIISASDIDD